MPAALRQRLVTAVVWALVVPGLVWSVVRTLGVEKGTPAVQLIAFTPYAALAAPVPLMVTLLARRWWAAGVASLSCIALVACVAPRAMETATASQTGAPLRVMAANMRVGKADAAALVALVRERHVDVLAVQEFTPAAQDRLAAAGIDALLPYQQRNPVDGVTGSAIYSRFPLSAGAVHVYPGGSTQVSAVVHTSSGAVVVESVHPVPPAEPSLVPYWEAGLRQQAPASAPGPPRVLAGDFNATLDHAELRRLLRTGYRDAATQVGAGLIPTWPYHGPRAILTPKVTLDHIFVDEGIGVRDFTAHTVPGTDHRAIIATLVLPAS